MMLHVRRAGPSLTDSLWMMGGISIENTTGNRYFDFEMYQTDIYYDRATRMFYNYGPDAGHTSWEFNPATGNMTKPGDIILTAEYSSSSLTAVEPRIWVHISALSIIPSGFDWTGTFDGASSGAQYGYAGIRPKTAGAFYTGLQSVANTWTGAFSLVLGDNSVLTTYTARQYMEFSVNLSKLGLDQAQIFGGDDCQMPFRRIIVKTRASTSFTAELKDFIAPFDFFLAPRAVLETQSPMICDTGSISTIYVSNAIPTSIYQWTTLNGNIVGSTTGPSIVVDTPGVYIVTQYLQSGCSVYATDTITIGSFGSCSVLAKNLAAFRSTLYNRQVNLQWKVLENQFVTDFEIERSVDGVNFSPLFSIPPDPDKTAEATYFSTDDISALITNAVFYRLKVYQKGNGVLYSRIIRHDLFTGEHDRLVIYPNPVKDNLQLQFYAAYASNAVVHIYDQTGRIAGIRKIALQAGANAFELDLLKDKPGGVYHVSLITDSFRVSERILLVK
jgi:Secretion system C-terminal sorting domain